MKVLLVDADARRARDLEAGLSSRGHSVTVAASGSFALTMLEWNRHEVVVSRARIDDMEGHELCAILKSDPGTREVRFVLLAANDEVNPVQTTAAGVDLVLPPTLPAVVMVPLVLRLVQGEAAPTSAPPPAATSAPAAPAEPPAPVAPAPIARPAASPFISPAAAAARAETSPPVTPVPPLAAPAPPAQPEAPGVPKLRPDPIAAPAAEPPKPYLTPAAAAASTPWAKAPAPPAALDTARSPVAPPQPSAINLDAMPSGTFQGSLEVMDFAELTQAIAMGGKSGRLILALPQGGGVVVFESSRVVHAEYRGTVGEAAFAALLAAVHADAAGRFCFLPSGTGEKSSPIRTIDKSVDRLLLSIATAIDEKG